MKTLKYTAILALAFLISTLIGAKAAETANANPFLSVLSVTTSAELPGKAADLVTQADSKQRQQTTIDVVKAAISLNPAAAVAVVGTIAHSSPEMAATAAATAVGLLPGESVAIATVAAGAAPSQAGKIVEAVCRVVPAAYEKVADAVAEVVPGAGKDILTGVATAVPSLKGLIDQILANNNGVAPSVDTVLAQVAQEKGQDVASAGPTAGPVAMGAGHGTPIPPYVAPSGTPSDISAASGEGAQPGERGSYPAP